MPSKPVDTAIVMVVGPCIDDTDFKSLEEAIAYDAAGMDVSLVVEKTDGTTAVTAITLTTGGTSDWTHKDGGYYEIEITAAQNAEEGVSFVRGVCTGVLPFESPHYDIVKANIYDSLIKGTDILQSDVTQIGGVVQSATDLKDMVDTGYDPATHKIQSDLIYIHGSALAETAGQLAAGFKKLFDVATPLLVASDSMRGTDSATLASMWTDAKAGYIDAAITGRSPASEYDEQFEDVRSLLKSIGSIFYVSKSGSNGDGTTWATAKTTIDAAIALCTANNGDRIYIDAGTYDENSGGIAGVTCDVAGIWIRGIVPGVFVKNTNTTNAGKVFTVTATNTLISDVSVEKGEITSDNSICIDVNGSGVVADIRNTTVAVEKSTHTGIRFTGGAMSCSYMDDDLHLSHIYSNAGVGTGIEFANCVGCIVVDPQIHDLTTGMKFTGGANCHHNTVSPNTVIASCDIGISLDAAAWSNILSALILNCTANYVDNSGVDTNDTDGSLTFVLDDIKASIVAASPQTHLATSDSTVTYGTVDSGTYEDTNTDNDTYWQISPVAVNALDMYSQFLIGTGRSPNAVDFNGRFQSHVARYCEVDAWNYDTAAWETISSDSNRIGHATSDFDRQFALTSSHAKAADGEIKIRVRSTSTTVGDDLYIDKLTIASVAQAAGGLTADAVASTVWNRHVDTLTGSNTTGSRLRRLVAVGTEISISDTTTSFTVASGETSADAYRGMEVRVGCSTEDYCETRRIIDWTAGRVITLDRALSSVPQVGDLVRIMNQYGNVDITESADLDAIKAKTDNLPSGIGKNEALPKFDVFMVLSTDHVTGAIAKTVTGTISKEGGAFAAITNTITEVSDGMYTIASGFTQSEMNADVVTLKFVADGCDTRIITIHTS